MCQVKNEKPYISKTKQIVYVVRRIESDGRISSPYWDAFWEVGVTKEEDLCPAKYTLENNHSLIGAGAFHAFLNLEHAAEELSFWGDYPLEYVIFEAEIPRGSVCIKGQLDDVDDRVIPTIATNKLKLISQMED